MLAIRRLPQAGLLEEDVHLQHVRDALGLGDEIMGDRGWSIARMRIGRRRHDAQLGRRLLAILSEARAERAVAGELPAQQRDAGFLVQRQIVRLYPGFPEQLGDHAFVDGAVLPQVQRGEMEAEQLDGADQPGQPAARCQRAIALHGKAAPERREIVPQILRARIGLALEPRGARRLCAGELLVSGGDARIDAGNRAAIGFVPSAGRIVPAGGGELPDGGGHGGEFARNGKLGAQFVQRIQIVAQRRAAGAAEREAELLCLHEGIAIAISADPGAEPQEAGHAMPQHAVPARIEAGQDGHEDVAKIGERIVDLVAHEQPLAAQRPGLPEQGDLAGDRILDRLAMRRLDRARIPQGHQIGDHIAVIDDRLAAHLGRMRGEHGHHQRLFEQRQHVGGLDAVLLQLRHRAGHIRARLGRDALPILGQIGEHGEQHEAAHEGERVIERQRGKAGIDTFGRRHAPRAIDRGCTNIFGLPKQPLPPINADHIAQQPPKIADVGILGDAGSGCIHGVMLHCSAGAPRADCSMHGEVCRDPR